MRTFLDQSPPAIAWVLLTQKVTWSNSNTYLNLCTSFLKRWLFRWIGLKFWYWLLFLWYLKIWKTITSNVWEKDNNSDITRRLDSWLWESKQIGAGSGIFPPLILRHHGAGPRVQGHYRLPVPRAVQSQARPRPGTRPQPKWQHSETRGQQQAGTCICRWVTQKCLQHLTLYLPNSGNIFSYFLCNSGHQTE